MIPADILDDILDDWKTRMTARPENYVPRDLDLGGGLGPELATIITGPRRAGKSTLLGGLPEQQQLRPERCWFCNFEDPKLVLLLGPDLLDAIVERARARRKGKGRLYFFFDEIQVVPHWEKWMHKALTGSHRDVFVLTGSNASMLSGELATSLTGRYRGYELFPFSYEEFQATRPRPTLSDYLSAGGFPTAVRTQDPAGYLKELFRNIVLRDIAPRVRARSTIGLLQVVSAVYQSVGSELSLRRLGAATGLAAETVGQYLEACEAAYLLFACPFFSYSQRQTAHRQKKYYAIDTALRAAVSGTAGRDRGKALENMIYLALRREGFDVAYWRDNGEVDFVIKSGQSVTPIQVSWDGSRPRHQKALDEFYARHPHAGEPIHIDANNAVSTLQRLKAELH